MVTGEENGYLFYSEEQTGDKIQLDLDKYLTDDGEYKIAFNVKPYDTKANIPAKIQIVDGEGNPKTGTHGILRFYTKQRTDGYKDYHYNTNTDSSKTDLSNYLGCYNNRSGSIYANGFDVEILWDRKTGKITSKFIQPRRLEVGETLTDPQETSEPLIKTWIWNSDLKYSASESSKIGLLDIRYGDTATAENTNAKVSVRNLRIHKVTNKPDEYTIGNYETSKWNNDKNGYLNIPLDDIIDTGKKYELKWNMKPGETSGDAWGLVNFFNCDAAITNSCVNANSQNRGLLRMYTDTNGLQCMGLSDWSKVGGLYESGAAIIKNGVDIQILWDTELGKATVKANFGGNYLKSFEWNPGKINGSYGYLSIGGKSSVNTISNLSISQVASFEAPVLSADDIKIFAGEVEQKTTKVVGTTDSFKVDFKQTMKESDITTDNIYVVKKGTKEKVNGTVSYNGSGLCTWKLANNVTFEPGNTYTIIVEKVHNKVGAETNQAYTKDFTVIESGVHADIASIIQNGEIIASLVDLTAGDAKANVSYTNDTGKNSTIYLIAAYYKNNRLVKAQLVDQAIENGTVAKDYEILFSVPEKESFDKVSIMVWDGLGTLVPLSDVVNF